MMRIETRGIVCALTLTAMLACKDSSSTKPPQNQPPPTPSKVWPMKPLDNQSDLDAKAAQDIDEANADAEFEKLKKEIEGGG